MSRSTRRFIAHLERMRMTTPQGKPYPIGRDHPRKQGLDEDLRSPEAAIARGFLSQIGLRVSFLINNISDLDTAAKHARLVVSKKVAPERAVSICNTIIRAMCNAKRTDDALDLFHFFFNESKLNPNIASCNLIIKSHCEQGRLDDALRLYSHLSANTPSPDHNTYDILTKALVDAGMMDQALDLLLKGRSKLFNFQQPAMYMNLIRGFLEQGNLDMAYELRDDFKTCSIRNRIEILNSVFVEDLFKKGKDEEAMDLYKSSLNNKDGFTTNGAVGNAYLKVLLKYGKKTQAWVLYQYMLDSYVYDHRSVFDDDNLNMMVNECFELERFSDAFNTFIKAKAKWKYMPVEAYRNLITRFCRNGKLSEAEKVFDELLKESFTKPDVATYTSLIHAYVEAGRAEDAVQTANKMISSNLQEATNLFF